MGGDRNADTALSPDSPPMIATGRSASTLFLAVTIHGSTPDSSPVTPAASDAARTGDHSLDRRRPALTPAASALAATIKLDQPAW
jgi:hypothetical protein